MIEYVGLIIQNVNTEYYCMRKRKKIGAVTIIIVALLIGEFLKNVKFGLILGLVFGFLASGLLSSKRNY